MKTLRMMALTALTITAIKIAQATTAPTFELKRSTARLKVSSFLKTSSPSQAAALCELLFSCSLQRLSGAGYFEMQPHSRVSR